MTDHLTGLPDRGALERRLAEALAGGRFWVLFVDVDGLGEVNERLGHLGGDAVMAAIGARLSGTGVGRWGGDELLAVLHDAPEARADEILAAIRGPVLACGAVVHPTASAGLAVRDPGDTRETLLARADAALRNAKRDGRDRWRSEARRHA